MEVFVGNPKAFCLKLYVRILSGNYKYLSVICRMVEYCCCLATQAAAFHSLPGPLKGAVMERGQTGCSVIYTAGLCRSLCLTRPAAGSVRPDPRH